MRLPGSEKLEIIRLVEQSHLPARRTLQMLGIRPSTFYRWYDRFRAGGPEALEDKPSRPDRVWNRIPDPVQQRLLAVGLTDHYRQILSLTRLDEAIEIHDDEAAALAAVSA